MATIPTINTVKDLILALLDYPLTFKVRVNKVHFIDSIPNPPLTDQVVSLKVILRPCP